VIDDLVRREIELAAARRVWRIRDQMTPSGTQTWAEWYQQRFGRSLDAAAAAFAQERNR
jgi:hypothetical protein